MVVRARTHARVPSKGAKHRHRCTALEHTCRGVEVGRAAEAGAPFLQGGEELHCGGWGGGGVREGPANHQLQGGSVAEVLLVGILRDLLDTLLQHLRIVDFVDHSQVEPRQAHRRSENKLAPVVRHHPGAVDALHGRSNGKLGGGSRDPAVRRALRGELRSGEIVHLLHRSIHKLLYKQQLRGPLQVGVHPCALQPQLLQKLAADGVVGPRGARDPCEGGVGHEELHHHAGVQVGHLPSHGQGALDVVAGKSNGGRRGGLQCGRPGGVEGAAPHRARGKAARQNYTGVVLRLHQQVPGPAG
eukprot:RCo054194